MVRSGIMTASSDDLHRLVDELPDDLKPIARQRLQELLEDEELGDPEETWSGEGLLSLLGSAEGPKDLSSKHDEYLDSAS